MGRTSKSKDSVTMLDVAQLAGVSAATVSHVINHNFDRVGPDKRERVLQAIRELNYRPNSIARSMKKRASNTIGIVVTSFDNATHNSIFKEIEAQVRLSGYHIILISASNVEEEKQAIEALLSQQVVGIIFMVLTIDVPNDHILQLKTEGIPFVVINRRIDDPGVNQINLDDKFAAYTATNHLISLGHTKIGTITGPISDAQKWRSAIERKNGWEQAMIEAKLAVVEDWIAVGEYHLESGYRAMEQLIKRAAGGAQMPTALFIAGFDMSAGALKALYDNNLRVPHDIAIVTIDDPPIAAYTVPALTTLPLPLTEAGKAAARILLDWIETGSQAYVQQLSLSFKIKVRESCGANLKK